MRRPGPWLGWVVGAAAFAFIALPWWSLFLLAERACDLGIETPCGTDWWTSKLIALAVVTIGSIGLGVGANLLFARRRSWPSSGSGSA